MYMKMEGVPGTGVDEDDSDAVAVAQWRWGMYEGCPELPSAEAEAYALTVVREPDPASPSIERLYLNRTGCPNLSLYEYAGVGASRVKATVLTLQQVTIVYYATVSVKDQDPLEIFGLRFSTGTVSYRPRSLASQAGSATTSPTTHTQLNTPVPRAVATVRNADRRPGAAHARGGNPRNVQEAL